jgi:hypothetical protein
MPASGSYSDLVCKIAAVVSTAELAVIVNARESSPLDSELALSFTSDATAAIMARPKTTTPQCVALIIKVDGTDVALSDVIGGVSVSRSYDQRLQSWKFSVALRDPLGPFGSPFNHAGPALCKRQIDFYGAYLTSTGLHVIPLIRGGVVDASSRQASSSGFTEDFQGVDRGGRFDQKTATLVLPPGHGLARGAVIRRLAREAGETQTALEGTARMLKEVQVVDGDWLSIAAEIEEVENRRVLWNADGYLSNPRVGRPRSGERLDFDFVEADFLSMDEVQVDSKADILTDVTLTGVQQLPRPTDACGDESVPTSVETIASTYTLAVPAFSQSTGGVYTPQSPMSPQENVRTRLILHEQTTRCGTLVWERTTTWTLTNPLAGRFVWDGGAHEWDHLACFTDSGSDDDSPAVQYYRELFRKTEVSETWYYYNRERFRRGDLVDPNVYAPLHAENGVVGTGADEAGAQLGFYLGSVTRKSAVYAPRAAVKTRDIGAGYPYDSWDTIEPSGGLEVFGDKSAWDTSPSLPWNVGGLDVAGSISKGEALIPVSEVVECQFASDAGFLELTLATTFSWGARRGSANLFGDGNMYSEDRESWRQMGTEENLYIKSGENLYTVVTSHTGIDGTPGDTTVSRGQAGAGPAIGKMEVQETSAATYDSTAEQTASQTNARRSDTKQIKVQVIAAGLEDCHEKGILKTEEPWAEDENELEAMAKAFIEDSAALTVRFTRPADFFLRECQVGHLRHVPIDLDDNARIKSVTWDKSPGSPLTTKVEALVYVW